jgi:hypothetical protein
MKQDHCIEDTAGFAEGGDAGGQAGGKARSTVAYRLPRGRLAKKYSTKGLGENKQYDPTQSPPRSQNPQFYVQSSSGFCWILPM